MTHEQQNFISHSFRGWKSSIRVPAQLGSSSGLQTFVSSHGGEQRASQLSLDSYQDINPIYEDTTLLTVSHPNYLPKAPPPNIIMWQGSGGAVGFQHMDFVGTPTFSLLQGTQFFDWRSSFSIVNSQQDNLPLTLPPSSRLFLFICASLFNFPGPLWLLGPHPDNPG